MDLICHDESPFRYGLAQHEPGSYYNLTRSARNTGVFDMDMSVEEWNKERNRLEEQLIAVALELRRHTGSAEFNIPIEEYGLQIRLVADSEADDAEELESEISDDAAKPYELKNEKYIDIEVQPASEADPHLFVTIGPDDSPPEDVSDDRA
jgi:hypothetical protein